jgi:hypothetical protein
MALYQQRTALQGPRAMIEQLVGAPPPTTTTPPVAK